MPEYYFAFYGEGKADYEFLLKVIERYLKSLVPYVDFVPDIVRHIQGETELERQLKLVDEYSGLHFIIVHVDADARTEDEAIQNRLIPDFNKKRIVPVIPIKETEAWLLADYEAFRQVVGTTLDAQTLNFPSQAHQVESINEPKEILNQAISQARSRRRRLSLDEIYQAMGETVSIEKLDKIPAFKKFQERLIYILSEELGFRDLE